MPKRQEVLVTAAGCQPDPVPVPFGNDQEVSWTIDEVTLPGAEFVEPAIQFIGKVPKNMRLRGGSKPAKERVMIEDNDNATQNSILYKYKVLLRRPVGPDEGELVSVGGTAASNFEIDPEVENQPHGR